MHKSFCGIYKPITNPDNPRRELISGNLQGSYHIRKSEVHMLEKHQHNEILRCKIIFKVKYFIVVAWILEQPHT